MQRERAVALMRHMLPQDTYFNEGLTELRESSVCAGRLTSQLLQRVDAVLVVVIQLD